MLLSLDISTSVIGFCLFSESVLVHWDFIDLKKKDSDLFDKFDDFVSQFEEKIKNFKNEIGEFAVEEALKKFTQGSSNANTITTLIAFNVLVSNHLRTQFGFKPMYVNVNSARKSAGLKFPEGTSSKQKKDQIAKYVSSKYQIDFPKKKTGTLKDHAYDVSDSIIIAESIINERLKQNKS